MKTDKGNKKKTESKEKGLLFVFRTDPEQKKRILEKAEKENLTIKDVMKYLTDGWLDGSIKIDIKVTVTQSKKK